MVGVAAAIKEGGAGVLFWMWVSSFLAMVVKFTEIKLSMRYRRVNGKGAFLGGAMYYMPGAAGKLFSLLCILCAFTVGGAMQVRAFTDACSSLFPFPPLLMGLLLCLPLLLVLFKGGHRFFDLSAALVPLMSLLYVVLCLGVILRFRQALPAVLAEIFLDALDLKSVTLGGGVGLLTALRLGVVRGILSNEAGCGTAPMAHTASSAASADAQGTLGMVEVAFDTLLLCTLSGLALLLCPGALSEQEGVSMLLFAFSTVFGRISSLLLPLAIFLFAFATILCWCYYGRTCTAFLLGQSSSPLLFDLPFLAVLLLSPLLSEGRILSLCDPVITCMTLLNLSALFLHRKELRQGKIPKEKK
jgi:AGCS family alanine or glycine:cation symporter